MTQNEVAGASGTGGQAIPDAPGFYTVDSRFTDPEREKAWNEWYNTHIDRLLAYVPGFVSSQRFRRADHNDGEYFGLHTLATGAVLTHPAYTSRGGTFPPQWLPLVTDWYRAFYIGCGRYPEVDDASVLVVSDQTPAEAAEVGIRFTWVSGAALTPRSPQRGLATAPREQGIQLGKRYRELVRVFAPITPLKRQRL